MRSIRKFTFNFIKIIQRKSTFLLLFTVVISTFLGYTIAAMIWNHPVDYYQVVDNLATAPNSHHRYILLWNPYFDNESWFLSKEKTLGKSFFKSIGCPQTECTITSDRNTLKLETEYDALLFHGAQPWTSLTHKLPVARSSRQLYIMGIQESPPHSRHDFTEQKDFFNWTMSYRLDSDVTYPYGIVKDRETQEIIAPKQFPRWRKQPDYYENEELMKIVVNKHKKIAWFASHCETHSRREVLVKEIGRIIPIDVYGKCGKLRCNTKSKVHDIDICNRMLTTDYKFYLSFENSLCLDYVTEKLYNSLQEVVIPVVFGGADYSKFAPPGSYINANDFETPFHLAEYLNYLDTNPREYIKYFWWRDFYEVPAIPAPIHVAFCNLCTKLHNPNIGTIQSSYGDIKKWWMNDICVNKLGITFIPEGEYLKKPTYT